MILIDAKNYALLHSNKKEMLASIFERMASNPQGLDLNTRAWFMAVIYDDIRNTDGHFNKHWAKDYFQRLDEMSPETGLLKLFVDHLDSIESHGLYSGPDDFIRDIISNMISFYSSFEYPLIESLVKQKLVTGFPELVGYVSKGLVCEEHINNYVDDLLEAGAFSEKDTGLKSISVIAEQFGVDHLVAAIETALNRVDRLGSYNSQYDDLRINAFINILKVIGEDKLLIEKITSRIQDENNLMVEFLSKAVHIQKNLDYPKITGLYLDNLGLVIRRLGGHTIEEEHLLSARLLGRDEEMCKGIAEAVQNDPFAGTASYILIASTLGLDALVKCAPDLSAKKAMGIYYNVFVDDKNITPKMFAKAYPNCKHQLLSADLGL